MWNDGGNFGGGGFLDNTFGSPSGDDKEKKKRDWRAENMVAVTADQILKGGEDFKIGQISVRTVSFVAMVKNIDMSSTKVTYLLEDYTGQIEALLWLEGPLENDPVSLYSYCRVCGTVRSSQGKRFVMIFDIEPVRDLNDLTIHLLEVIDIHQNAPDYLDAEENADAQGSSSMNKPLVNSMMNMNQIDDGLDQNAPSDPQQRMVFKVISDAAAGVDEGGVNVSTIAKKLNGRFSQDQVRSITDYLLHEGFIFSTIDDEHFTVTR